MTKIQLFQYGKYGLRFELDITRQFIKSGEDEYPYQLSMTLFFDPIECESYNCWSSEFDRLKEWLENIKESQGYMLAKKLNCKKFKLRFEQY